jgi:two-component system, response regulator YesN
MPAASAPHILVVDDEPSIREALTLALAGSYVVHAAATGDEACRLLRNQPIAAIVLDAILGDEHGLDLVERVRTLSHASILLLTGHSTEELAIRALRAQVSEYLKKPVNLHELRAALVRLVQQAEPPPDPVARAHRHLTEQFDQPYTTATLARELRVSERHLRRRFLEAYGKTPQRYLTEARLKRAAELLRRTAVGIEQVANAVGFPSLKTFSRSFKRAFGLTPSDFREGIGQRESQGPFWDVDAPRR